MLETIVNTATKAYNRANSFANILPKEFYLSIKNQNGQPYIDWTIFNFSGTKTVSTKIGKTTIKKSLSTKKNIATLEVYVGKNKIIVKSRKDKLGKYYIVKATYKHKNNSLNIPLEWFSSNNFRKKYANK